MEERGLDGGERVRWRREERVRFIEKCSNIIGDRFSTGELSDPVLTPSNRGALSSSKLLLRGGGRRKTNITVPIRFRLPNTAYIAHLKEYPCVSQKLVNKKIILPPSLNRTDGGGFY